MRNFYWWGFKNTGDLKDTCINAVTQDSWEKIYFLRRASILKLLLH